jgi:hypothetical protein
VRLMGRVSELSVRTSCISMDVTIPTLYLASWKLDCEARMSSLIRQSRDCYLLCTTGWLSRSSCKDYLAWYLLQQLCWGLNLEHPYLAAASCEAMAVAVVEGHMNCQRSNTTSLANHQPYASLNMPGRSQQGPTLLSDLL